MRTKTAKASKMKRARASRATKRRSSPQNALSPKELMIDKMKSPLFSGPKGSGKKDNILDLGSGHAPIEGADHLDRDPDCPHVEYLGDIRGLFCNDFREFVGNLKTVRTDFYDQVHAIHFVGYIEWIHQELLFDQIRKWLKPGGKVVVETPNLAYVIKMIRKRNSWMTFPLNEHPYIKKHTRVEYVRWLNFKLLSGCSLGDNFCTLFNPSFLKWVLKRTGFTNIQIRSGKVLRATAIATEDKSDYDVDDF